MTTILPTKNKQEIKAFYRNTFIFRILIALSFVFFVWLVLEGTIYYIISSQKDTLSFEYKNKNDEEKNNLINEYKDKVSESKELMRLFTNVKYKKTEVGKFVFSSIPEGITINNVSIEDFEDLTYVGIGGISKNRDTLSSYKELLDDSENAVSVELPVSSFIKTFDIPFTITFVYENK